MRDHTFRDVSVMDKNPSITGYQITNQLVKKNSDGVMDENIFSSEFEKNKESIIPIRIINHIFEKQKCFP